nr:zinc finger, SWIM-type [Tanacetum cinerariifolium]
MKEGCEIVKVRDKRASGYRTLSTEKEKEVVQQKEYVAEYKVLLSLEDGSVECTCRHFLRYGFLCRHAFCVLKNRDIEKTCDVIEDIYAVEKPQQNDDNNPQRARNKGGRRREHRKSGREIALKAKTRQIRKCLCCVENTNKHTKSCPSNLKYVAKLARLVAAAEQGTTTAAATEQATTTVIVFEEVTNAS